MENSSSSTLPRKKAKTGVKKTGVKKTGKKSTGKKKPTSSTSAVHLAAPYNPYPANTQYAPNYAPLPQTVVIEKPTVVSYLLAISLGLYILTSCAWTMADYNNTYLAELSTNATYDISLRVGYFGGCLSVTDAAAVSSSDGNSSAQTFTNCVSNMRRKDLDDLSEDLWEHLDHEVSGAQSDVQTFLNTTLPQFKHLQNDVFFCEPPLVHALLFFISGIMLLVARTGTSKRKSYKAMLVIAITFSAFSLALALVTVLGTLQGMNALLDTSSSGEQRDLGDSLYISRGKRMLGYQGALTGIVGVFYISMGVLFVQRTPEGAAGTENGGYEFKEPP
ncbi:uncharacterized protein N7518_003066 [Penicillium psychrosexuale]|uniref:uncharacterized protein n=1 Tax=Penicillium psychrosexuale TaxID=1002107 RepID=UPI0025451A28|nr:uncharacterized protein N7518_003066 [Penicillium psychrosexuale]KAJ5800998.1 hypothetical protein N7518_003066 [Penicillium psychrosexuale]